jgi:hypothetical protein
MLYLIDQLKLQFIVCYEGLQWYMLYLIDQSKLQFIFCYEGLQWYVISDRSVKVTVCFLLWGSTVVCYIWLISQSYSIFFVMRVYSGMLYLIDQSKLQVIFCYEGLQWYVIVISDRSVKVTVYFLLWGSTVVCYIWWISQS